MSRQFFGTVATLAMILTSCGSDESGSPEPVQCSDTWYRYVDGQLTTGDGQGHGPDLGSSEWRSVVEFKLGIRGDSTIPDLATEQWCTYIDEKLQNLDEF